MTSATCRKPRILVIDDEPAICHSLTDALNASGFQALSATSPEGALQLARQQRPDLVIADLRLGDQSGADFVQSLRAELGGDLPAVIITGHSDLSSLSAATRLRPVEVLKKPIDIHYLALTVRAELARLERARRVQRRTRRLRELSKTVNRQRRKDNDMLGAACADLTVTCRSLQGRLERQGAVIRYQSELLRCADEDDIFRRLFRLFVDRTGPVCGVAMLCDAHAELQMIGRFGVPRPDGVNFCQSLAAAMLPLMLQRPEATVIDAGEHIKLFPAAIRKLLVGVTLMAVPLMACEGQMIGLVVLYRKGEQPFTDDDVAMAEMIAPPTAAAAQKT
jgi:DNA-binding response OmpR family regulator